MNTALEIAPATVLLLQDAEGGEELGHPALLDHRIRPLQERRRDR